MTSYRELRERLQAWPKYDGCETVRRAPLLTAAFPGAFNMSSTEHHWLGEYGGFLDWKHDFVFSTVQSCVRADDIERLRLGGRWHLGVFEMADLNGEVALAHRPDYRRLQGWQLEEVVRFFATVGIPADRVHASYCAGGPVAELTGGAYDLPVVIPPDTLSHDALCGAGVPEENLIPDRTRDTLLSLHVHRPTPWGYRNEIFVNIGTRTTPDLVDVATSEYLTWRPVFEGAHLRRDSIVDLTELDAGAIGIGVGVERLCAVVNGLDRVHDVDYLRPFYTALRHALPDTAPPEILAAGESLRALHRIYTDLHFHPEAVFRPGPDGDRLLSPKRRKRTARLKRNVSRELDPATLAHLLAEHAATQSWHPHLSDAIEATVRAVTHYPASNRRPA